MADNTIRVFPDSTGGRVDTEGILSGLNTVHRQRIRIGGLGLADLATVTSNKLDVNATQAGVWNTSAAQSGTWNVNLQDEAVSAAALSNVAASATSVPLAASNSNRKGLIIVNDSGNSTLLIKLGTAASSTSFSYSIGPGGTWELPYKYKGAVDGIWIGTVSGTARVTELT